MGIIGIASCGALPASIKGPITAGADGLVDLAMNCLKAEAESKVSFLPKAMNMGQFIEKIDKVTTPKIKSVVHALLSPLRSRRMTFHLPSFGALTKLAGTALKNAAKPLVCVPLVTAIKGAAMAVGIIYLPACVTDKVKHACEAIIDKAAHRRQILRRLAARKREIQTF